MVEYTRMSRHSEKHHSKEHMSLENRHYGFKDSELVVSYRLPHILKHPFLKDLHNPTTPMHYVWTEYRIKSIALIACAYSKQAIFIFTSSAHLLIIKLALNFALGH